MTIFPILFWHHQIDHYKARIADARTIEERIFLKQTLHGLLLTNQVFYN